MVCCLCDTCYVVILIPLRIHCLLLLCYYMIGGLFAVYTLFVCGCLVWCFVERMLLAQLFVCLDGVDRFDVLSLQLVTCFGLGCD